MNPRPADSAPYYQLTPDRVLDALQAVGLTGDGRLIALASYENRVYQAGIDAASPVVVKFYRPGRWSNEQILEEHRFTQELFEREIPVVAPIRIENRTLHEFEGFRFAVYARCAGRAPELERSDTLEWMGRFIGRIHSVGALEPFVERPALGIESFGTAPRAWLLEHGFIPDDLLPAWKAAVDQALQGVGRCYERAGSYRSIRLHGDCHAGNVLWIDDDRRREGETAGPHFVDFDDARSGPAIQDLWMLLPPERDAANRARGDVLAGYEDFCEFSPRELNLVEALRTLRLIHYSAWIASRWEDPAFPAAFPWFNTQRYWQDRILELKEQIALMDEPPLAA